jgi:hypothetical protein
VRSSGGTDVRLTVLATRCIVAATVLRAVFEAGGIVVCGTLSAYCSVGEQCVIHTVTAVVTASTALVVVVVVTVGVAFYGLVSRPSWGMEIDSARTRSANGATLISTINSSFE